MTHPLDKTPMPLRMLLGGLAFFAILIGLGLAFNWKSNGVLSIDATHGPATVHFAADRAVAIWPLACVRVDWSVEEVAQIFLNDQPVVGSGSEVLCGADRAVFRVVYRNKDAIDYPLTRAILSQAYVLTALALSVAIGPLLLYARRKRIPALVWIMGGFALSYLLFFVIPTFLAVDTMAFPMHVPATPDIGTDLHTNLSFSQSLLSGGSPYPPIGGVLNLYPPLQTLLLVPLTLIPERIAFWLVSLLTLACFSASALILPSIASAASAARGATAGGRITPVIMLIFVTGLISYGLQFELERGQFNVIAMAFCFAAIYVYHFRPKLRLLAYALFVVSVQLKLYPLIFILLLVDDWKAWKRNLTVFAGIGAANVALLFVLGPGTFMEFVRTLSYRSDNVRVWAGSGSITSFAGMLPEFGLIPPGMSQPVAISLFAIFAACLGLILWRAFKRNTGRLDFSLLLACTIGAIIIPGVSNDYKLPILVPAIALILNSQADASGSGDDRFWLTRHSLLFLIAFFYSTLLYSYVVRAGVFALGLPASMFVLMSATALAILPDPTPQEP